MDVSLLNGKLFQLGYVVCDLEAGVETMKARAGVPKWQVIHLPAGSLIEGMAFAYMGGVMLELIAVDPADHLDVYHRHVPTSPQDIRFHHLGYMMDSEEEFHARVAQSQAAGFPEAFSLDFNGALTYYADSLDRLGHFCEFVFLKPQARDFFAGVPHN
jgi:hypothetical protein